MENFEKKFQEDLQQECQHISGSDGHKKTKLYWKSERGAERWPGHQCDDVRSWSSREPGCVGSPGVPQEEREEPAETVSVPFAGDHAGHYGSNGNLLDQSPGADCILNQHHTGWAERDSFGVWIFRICHDFLQSGDALHPPRHGTGEVPLHRVPVPLREACHQTLWIHHHPLHLSRLLFILLNAVCRLWEICAILSRDVVFYCHESRGDWGPGVCQRLCHCDTAHCYSYSGMQLFCSLPSGVNVPGGAKWTEDQCRPGVKGQGYFSWAEEVEHLFSWSSWQSYLSLFPAIMVRLTVYY